MLRFYKLLAAILIFSAAGAFAQSPVVKVDINMSGRSELECNDPNYLAWIPDNAASISKTVNGVTFTFKKAGSNGTALRATWYKAGVSSPSYARLVCDGMLVDGANAGAQIELTITGLSTGTHSLMAFHNALDDPATYTFSPLDVTVDGAPAVTGLVMSKRALTTDATQSSYVTFNATAGKSVVILYKAQTSGSATVKNVYINGFELNTPNVKEQAKDPYPADGDMHTDADNGSLILKWTAAASAAKHRIYFSTDKAAVTNGTAAALKTEQTAANYTLTGMYSMNTYYWRVDEITSAGVVTKGNVWVFRPRHLAFPGAEGYGRFAIGGRGGKVVHVTNLNDSGAGSLRYALEEETGPRTVVFDVSGVIVSGSRMVCSDPYVTVAAQTAPAPGICIRSAPLGLTGNDNIGRFIRMQIGYGKPTTFDGMGLTGSNHSILDHSSINFAIDEQFSSRSGKNITVQNMLIAEALNAADHQNYPSGTEHGYAGSIGGDIGSFHHNLLAHNYGRNWSQAGGLDGNNYYAGRLQIVNTVVYNFGGRVTDGGCKELDFVNNYYKQGPGSSINNFSLSVDHENTGLGMQRAYFAGNIFQLKNASFLCDGTDNTCGRRETFSNGDSKKYECFVAAQFSPTYVTTQSATNAFKVVLSDCGVTQPAQSARDIRIITEAKNGTSSVTGSVTGKKGFPDREADAGGYDAFANNTRPANWDSDGDGLPDFWEIFYGTNKNSAAGDFSDSNADEDKDGYTELEEYLNWLAAPHYTIAYNATQTIDLATLFRGFSAPTYSTANVVGGTITAAGSKITFTPSGCGFASFDVKATEDGFTMTRSVGVFVESNPAGSCVSTVKKAPVISITAPANNTIFTAPAAFSISVAASDADGTVTYVQIYDGTRKVVNANLYNGTYTINMTNISAGTHSYTAVTTDNDGLTTTSKPVVVIVEAAVTPISYVYTYDNLGDQTWAYTGNWLPASAPSRAIDTAVIRSGEVRVTADLPMTIKVESNGIVRAIGNFNFLTIELLGGALKVNTSNQTYGMKANIVVKEESSIISGPNPLTLFTLDGTIAGSANLVKKDLGLLKITADATDFKGLWIVAQDTLTIASATGLGQCGAIVDTAVLDIDVAATTNALTLHKMGKLNLNANLTVQAAVFGDMNLPAGTYSSADYPAYISGTGTLTVAKNILVASALTNGSITLSSNAGTAYNWLNGTTSVSAAASYTASASGAYTVSATNSVGCAVTSAPVSLQTISLQKGWNLISINLHPAECRNVACDVSTIFNGLDVQEIKDMNSFWRKGQPDMFNGLKTITAGEGYLVNMNASGTLTVAGVLVETHGRASLQTNGWQLIGCPYQTATGIAGILASTFSELKDFEGFNIPGNANNSIQNLEPGKGYFIKK